VCAFPSESLVKRADPESGWIWDWDIFFIYFRYEDWEIELKYDLQRGVLGIRGVAMTRFCLTLVNIFQYLNYNWAWIWVVWNRILWKSLWGIAKHYSFTKSTKRYEGIRQRCLRWNLKKDIRGKQIIHYIFLTLILIKFWPSFKRKHSQVRVKYW
jgi:hypothetical protein